MSGISSIPTQYKEIQFRSRFEADFARVLDKHCVDWQYEPQSFLLETGVHFWPDFYLPLLQMWVELRGYVSEKGEAQIAQFARELQPGHRFMVVRVTGEREIFRGPFAERNASDQRAWSKELRLWANAMTEFDTAHGSAKSLVMHKWHEDDR